jgi:ribosomal 50S subunit-associated protein YjgA (DUF615 family)
VSPLEAILSVRDRVIEETDRALAALVVQAPEYGVNDLRATRLVLVDLYDQFTKRGDKKAAEAFLACAQLITSELR